MRSILKHVKQPHDQTPPDSHSKTLCVCARVCVCVSFGDNFIFRLFFFFFFDFLPIRTRFFFYLYNGKKSCTIRMNQLLLSGDDCVYLREAIRAAGSRSSRRSQTETQHHQPHESLHPETPEPEPAL